MIEVKARELRHTLFVGNRFILIKRIRIIASSLKLRARICAAWSCATACSG